MIMTTSELIPRSFVEPTDIGPQTNIRGLAAMKSGLDNFSILHLLRVLLGAVNQPP